MILFTTPITAFLTDAEMQTWYDGNPPPLQLVYHEGGNGYYLDDTFTLQQVDTGKAYRVTDDPNTGNTSWTWEARREILALFVNGVLFYQVASSPGAGEFTYDVDTGVLTKTANFSGETIHIIYNKIWAPTPV